MNRTEIWAIPSGRITDFFRSIPEVQESDSGFQFQDCLIQVEPMENRYLAGMPLPQTRVWFSGSEKDVSTMYNRFFLRFISAGG